MSPSAFVSSSFSKEDKVVVSKIIKVLKELGIEYYQAQYVPELPDGIVKKIKEHDLFIAILTPGNTKRSSLNTKKPSGNTKTPSDYVKFEIAAAITSEKTVIILREDVVRFQTIYGRYQQQEFNREKLVKGNKKQIKDIKKGITEKCISYGLKIGKIDPELDRRYEFAKSYAQQLGSRILGFFNESLYRNEIKDHAVKNFPTEADRRANNIIVHAIQNETLTMNDGIISEENMANEQEVLKILNDKEFVWIIDPLDGTLNFAYGFPFFCVSLGLIREGKPVMGVLYNPPTQELYCSTIDSQPECIDLKSGTKRQLKLGSTKEKLSDCIVMTHLSSHDIPRKHTINILDDIMRSCRSIRMLGSGQMALATLSLSQFDIFFNFQTNIWDIVPGYVIVKAAGGYVTSSLEGENWDWKSRGIIAATNGVVGEEFRKLLSKKLTESFPTY